jgi:hypothetical protein
MADMKHRVFGAMAVPNVALLWTAVSSLLGFKGNVARVEARYHPPVNVTRAGFAGSKEPDSRALIGRKSASNAFTEGLTLYRLGKRMK